MLVKQKISDSKLSFKENTNSLMTENPKYLILDNKNALQKESSIFENFNSSFSHQISIKTCYL